MEIVMDSCQVQVVNGPNGAQNIKALVAIDIKSGLRVIIPLTLDDARKVGTALASGIVIATAPIDVRGNGQSH